MTLGNLVALTQDNVKRMLAYSSIAHTGYMLVGLAAWAGDPQDRSDGIQALLFYGVAYAFMNLGAFAVIAALQKRTGVTSSLGTFAGSGPARAAARRADDAVPAVADRHPADGRLLRQGRTSSWPPSRPAGRSTILAVITVLNAAVAAFYYLRVIVYMFMRDSPTEAPAAPPRGAAVGRAGGGLGAHDPARAVPDGAARRRRAGGSGDRGHDPELT